MSLRGAVEEGFDPREQVFRFERLAKHGCQLVSTVFVQHRIIMSGHEQDPSVRLRSQQLLHQQGAWELWQHDIDDEQVDPNRPLVGEAHGIVGVRGLDYVQSVPFEDPDHGRTGLAGVLDE